MIPYEVFFFSSGAVEERWQRSDLILNRANVYLGFPLGAALTLSLMAISAVVFATDEHHGRAPFTGGSPHRGRRREDRSRADPRRVLCRHLQRRARNGAVVRVHDQPVLRLAMGKLVRPLDAARFHLVVILSLIGAALLALTAIDPVKLTEYTVVLAAARAALTYFPILVVANDPDFMGDKVNSRLSNAFATVYFGILIVVSVATIPLMIATKGGRMSEQPAGRHLYAALQLLDRQILDADSMMAGKVDDLELEQSNEGYLYVTTILSGLGALGPRLGGRLGRWFTAVHRRLHPDPEPGPARISFGVVKRINNHVELTVRREDLENQELEVWVRDHVIGRTIPGASHAPE